MSKQLELFNSVPFVDEVEEFNDLMKNASDDMIKLSSLFEDADDVRATLTQLMWSNCKACHSKFRAPH